MNLTMPKMITFDYGNTLCYALEYDFKRGYRELFKHVIKNPDGITPEKALELSDLLFNMREAARNSGCELDEFQRLRTVAEYYGLELDITLSEAEAIIWNSSAPLGKMPYISELLQYLRSRGIRTGVISNLSWSGAALKSRIDHFIPENSFEFVISSSDYGIRKPNDILFKIAVRKSGLKPEEIWHCGDTILYDVKGAVSAGFNAVLYEDFSVDIPYRADNEPYYGTEKYLHIKSWRDLISALEKFEIKESITE